MKQADWKYLDKIEYIIETWNEGHRPDDEILDEIRKIIEGYYQSRSDNLDNIARKMLEEKYFADEDIGWASYKLGKVFEVYFELGRSRLVHKKDIDKRTIHNLAFGK